MKEIENEGSEERYEKKPNGCKRGVRSDGDSREFKKWIGRDSNTWYEMTNAFTRLSDYEIPIRRMFSEKSNMFPSEYTIDLISTKSKINDYIKKYSSGLIATRERNGSQNKNVSYGFYLDKKKILCYLSTSIMSDNERTNNSFVLVFDAKDKQIQKKIDEIKKLEVKSEKENGCLYILAQQQGSFYLSPHKITKPEIDFSCNYNDDFKPIHDLIIDKLSTDNSKGLVLLHGNAGTGKTTYIRYLIHQLKKRVIYIPPSMTNVISDPSLIKSFLEWSNSILVIEDAENVLMKRTQNSTQAVSNILNLTDGLLSDCANIQIVATFNTDVLNIDEALLRKGRLIAKYEFKPLSEDRVKILSKKLGVNIDSSRTLADIYNAEEMSFTKEKSKIGFKK